MAYVGNTPADKTLKLEKQQFTTSATTSYTLSHSVSDPQDIALFINNVRQNPNSSYTVSGTTLTLSAATASTDTMYCVFLGRAIGTVGIGAGSVTKDKVDFISDSSGSGVISKGDGSSIDGSIQLNCHVNSHGIKLKSPPHSAGQSYTLTFPSTAPSAGKVLQTDGSGNLSFADAGDNTPRWGAYIGSDQTGLTNNVITKGAFNTEHFDSDGAFDTSNYRFTVPSGKAGVYFVTGFVTFQGTSNAHGRSMYSWIYKNGAGILRPGYFLTSQYFEGSQGNATSVTGIFDLSDGDYLELYGQKYDNGGIIKGGASLSYFGGFKLS
jgi:hypothetical protein